MKYFCLLLFLCPALVSAGSGTLVKCVHTNGSVVYTNKKCESGKAEKIKLNPADSAVPAVAAEFAFATQESNIDVTGQGEVIQILADDKADGRHQRFIVKLASGHMLLIAHNIDFAPRIAELEVGDTIQFYGEYLWSEKGGLLHRTHRDPKGKHRPGWIVHKGKRYDKYPRT